MGRLNNFKPNDHFVRPLKDGTYLATIVSVDEVQSRFDNSWQLQFVFAVGMKDAPSHHIRHWTTIDSADEGSKSRGLRQLAGIACCVGLDLDEGISDPNDFITGGDIMIRVETNEKGYNRIRGFMNPHKADVEYR